VSAVYIQRLRSIRGEYDAAQEALQYILLHWQSQGIAGSIQTPGLSPKHFQTARANLETTYFLRLYSEFEGIMKDHLVTNHPSVAVPERPKVDELIAVVRRAVGFAIDPVLRSRLDEVRDYRNAIAHSQHGAVLPVTFADALSRLNTLLAKLPDPLS
jgi:hypothetical protein